MIHPLIDHAISEMADGWLANSPWNLTRGRGIQQLVKTICSSLLESRRNVTVGVQSHLYARMSQFFLDDPGMDALLHHERGMGVSGVVEPDAVRAAA